ncbi:MAG: HAD family hydrolase [Dehalococcoidales bacterium]|nr:HAD family hydrolase [Dehalococcoidales bacterium]
MKYRAAIFDLDGTLLNTLEDIANSTNKGLARLNFPQHEIEAYKQLIGEGREFLALHSLPEHHRDSATVEKLLAYINEEYSKHWADNTHPYPDIPELLDSLTARNLSITVLSNKADDLTKTMVSKLLSRWHFDLVIGAMPALPKKPDPKGALQIAKQLGISPSQFLYIGDSEVDMKTACSANMYPVGALWGFRCADELLAGGAKTLIKHPQELLPLL